MMDNLVNCKRLTLVLPDCIGLASAHQSSEAESPQHTRVNDFLQQSIRDPCVDLPLFHTGPPECIHSGIPLWIPSLVFLR